MSKLYKIRYLNSKIYTFYPFFYSIKIVSKPEVLIQESGLGPVLSRLQSGLPSTVASLWGKESLDAVGRSCPELLPQLGWPDSANNNI